MSPIPPYFAYQRTEKAGVVTITALDLDLDQDLIPAASNLVVHANDLTLCGELSIPGKSVFISARKIISKNGSLITTGRKLEHDYAPGDRAEGGDTAGKVIVPDGQPGNAGKDGQTGSKGEKGGDIFVVADLFENHLELIANGGVGGRGQDGGNGGRGHDGIQGADARIRKAFNDRIEAPPTPGGPGGKGGNGGNAGRSGPGGDGGDIFVGSLTKEPDVSMSSEGGAGGANADPGIAGNGGSGGLGGRKAKCRSFATGTGDVITDCDYIDERAASGLDGSPGEAGQPALSADSGSPGSRTISRINYPDFLSKFPSSIEQRNLTLHKAKLAYLTGQYRTAKDLLEWLQRVTPQQRDALDVWGSLHQQVTALLLQLSQGLDYYGYSLSYVPLVSLRYYQKTLSTLLVLGNQIEGVYRAYLDADGDQQKQRSVLQASLALARENLKKAQGIKDNVIAEKNSTQDAIARITEELVNQEKIMQSSEEKFKDDLANYFELEVFSNVLKMMTTLVIAGGEVYAAGSDITKIAGTLIETGEKFANMIKEVRVVGEEVSDITTQWNAIQFYNTVENPDAAKLLIKREQFDEVMKKFVDKFPSAIKYQTQVHNFLDTVQSRNQKVIDYNALAIKEIGLEADIRQKECELAQIQDHLASEKDPTLPPMRMFLFNLYEGLKKNILDYLYQENQAFRYWSLSWNPFSTGDNTIAEMSAFHADLEGKITDQLNARGKPLQPFEDIQIVLKRAEMPAEFKLFEERSKLTFTLPITDPRFLGIAQVIATNFKVKIPKASTKNDILHVRLRSSGRAPFFNTQGDEFDFYHAEVTALYEYRISTGKFMAGGSLGGDEDEYIGLSPFTTWTIELPANYNPGLNLKRVNEIVISFSGRGLPMDDDAKTKVEILSQRRAPQPRDTHIVHFRTD